VPLGLVGTALSGCASLEPKPCLEIPALRDKVENSSGIVRTENENDLHAARVRCQLELAGMGQQELLKNPRIPTFTFSQWSVLLQQAVATLRSWRPSASTFGP
jgi:hypothetical protein